MSNKSKKLNRPFNDKDFKTAKKIAEKYEIILSFEDNEYYGRGLEMPNVFGEGKTPNECYKNTREALTAAVAHLIEKGEHIPAPASEGLRTAQVNIRLTPTEKVILSATAHSKGFQGLGDFIRARALSLDF